jgi:hypothetical protein
MPRYTQKAPRKKSYGPMFVADELLKVNLSDKAFKVLGYLVCRANEKLEAWPSIAKIKVCCGGRRNTIVDALRELESRNIIQINRTGRSNHYTLNEPPKWTEPLVHHVCTNQNLATSTQGDTSDVPHVGYNRCTPSHSADPLPERPEVPDNTSIQRERHTLPRAHPEKRHQDDRKKRAFLRIRKMGLSQTRALNLFPFALPSLRLLIFATPRRSA